jgi:hypothetical protein
MSALCRASNRATATARATRRPGGPDQPRKRPAVRWWGTCVGRAHGTITMRVRWQLAGDKMHPGSTSGALGWRQARRGPMGLSEDVVQWRGCASGFGRRRSTTAGELWWLVVTAVWSCSSEEDGRGEVRQRLDLE